MTTSHSVRDGMLNVSIDQENGSLVLRASGEIDMGTVETLKEQLLRAFSADGAAIILDLNGVDFIDSTGLRTLIWAAERSRQDADRLRIVCGSGQVRRTIDLTRLDRLLPLA